MIIDIQIPTPEMLASDGNQRYVDFEQYIDSNKIYYIELGFTYSLDVNISKVVGKLLNFKYGVCECEIWNNTAESLCDISNCCIVPMGKGKILPAGDVTDYTLLKFNLSNWSEVAYSRSKYNLSMRQHKLESFLL